ncbi:MAG TPA: PDZ domain-containing protein [Myxococcales bacterium]|jgi:hypothetical protein
MTRLGISSGERRPSSTLSARLAALPLALGALAGCAGPARYFVGDPQAAPHLYWNPDQGRRPDLPLEDQFSVVAPSVVQVLDVSPATAWRPLGDLKVESTTAADALSILKDLAGRFGADGLLRLAAGAGSQRTTRSPESFSRYGANFELPASELIEASYGVAGTALRRASPGSEAYLGVGCSGYLPTGAREADAASGLLVPYVSASANPAAAAGMSRGDFVLAWHVEGSEEVLSADCGGLNEALQAAGPGKTIAFTLWKPEAAAREMLVRVPHPRIMGADINPNESDQLRVDRVLSGSPAAAAGLHVGDIVLSVNGKPVADIDQTVRAIRSGPPRQRIEVLREGKALGIEVQTAPLTSVSARDVPRVGVLVQWVYSVGVAAEDELRPGDVLLDYATTRDFVSALKAQGDDLRARIRREGTPREVNVTLEAIPDSRYRLGAALFDRSGAQPVPASLASPAAESPRGCARDIECKGERICVKGECTDPKK